MPIKVAQVRLERPTHRVTKANRLRHPAEATLWWSNTSVQTVKLTYLASGASRDVFAAYDYPLILKLQRAEYHDTSNQIEYDLSTTSFQEFMPVVYGIARCDWNGEDISVLVMQRVPHTLRHFCRSLIGQTDIPAENHVHLLVRVLPAVLEQLTKASKVHGFQLKDLHWDNIGVGSEAEVILQKNAGTYSEW